MDELIKIIAKTIGYHFWKSSSDKEAEQCGMDAAKDVIKALKENQSFELCTDECPFKTFKNE